MNRMNRRNFLLCLTLALSQVAACSNQEDARKSIQSRYDQFNLAWAGKDRKKVEDIFAPDCKFKQTDEGRALTLPQFMQGIEFSFRAMTVVSVKTQIDTLKLDKDSAEVTASTTSEVRIAKPEMDGNQSQPQLNKSTQIVRDTWKKTTDGWRIILRVIEG